MVRSGLRRDLRTVVGLRIHGRDVALRPSGGRLVPGGRSPLVESATKNKLSSDPRSAGLVQNAWSAWVRRAKCNARQSS